MGAYLESQALRDRAKGQNQSLRNMRYKAQRAGAALYPAPARRGADPALQGEAVMAGDDKEKVVFLAFSNPTVKPETAFSVHACRLCRNKTFTLVCEEANTFPMLRCACCGQNMGRMGWTDDK
jgi:hypothetical protein